MRVVLADVPMFPELLSDITRLADEYTKLGIEVKWYPVPEERATKDSVFLRDVFAWTPFKFVRPQSMGKESRQWESTAFFEHFFPEEKDRHQYYWLQEGTFEGADLLFTTLRHAFIAIGKRTSEAAATRLVEWLEHKDPYCTNDVLYLPDWHEQHLLGLVNAVQGDQIYIDSRVKDECGENAPVWVEDAIALPHEEYNLKHTNWTQYQDKIILNSSCSKTRAVLESRGLTVIPVDIPALVAQGGGVACTTGIWQP
jgi:N-dimethylarginine dimethylaminohydrolase